MSAVRAHAHAVGERGSGAVVVLAIVAAVLTGFVGVLAGAIVTVAHARAAATADSAALAAAAAALGLVDGTPCGAATRVATANGGSLDRCEVDGATAGVRVSVGVGHGTSGGLSVGADAVAGPG